MQRKHVLSEGEYYHLYNRGVEKRNIFVTENDRQRFIRLLYIANGANRFIFRDIENKSFDEIDRGEPLVAIGAWVLMPNHFHILVKEITTGGTSAFMAKLLTGYSSYFNKFHNRIGPLFQGRYRSQHVEQDEHLKYLLAYIHLNPVKIIEPKWKDEGIHDMKRTEKYLENYNHSSYRCYKGDVRKENRILSKEAFPEYFLQPKDFQIFLRDWLSRNT